MATTDDPAEQLTVYLTQAIGRAAGVFSNRPPVDPQHALALGEAVALFNLADEFGLVAAVRATVDADLGYDVYARLSEAMKTYYLGQAARPSGSPPGRPSGQSRPPHRPPRSPESRFRDGRPRPAP
ncbi:MAG: hypothetical protein IT340_18190 [Chloroflexi bacterium]|nr:hypothetical protein [Chloroflexota bacterium]